MTDPAASALHMISEREAAVHMPFSPHKVCELSQRDVRRLLAVVDALLAEHGSEPWYENADNCGHPEPADDGSDEWAEWAEDHPSSRDPDVDVICLLTEVRRVCPACTKANAETCGGDAPEYAEDCPVRATITRVLNGDADG